MVAYSRTAYLQKQFVSAFFIITLTYNNIVFTSCSSCKSNAEPSRTFGGLEAIVDAATVAVNEMLQLAKQRITDLEANYCERNENEEKIDTDSAGDSCLDPSQKEKKTLFRDCAEAYKNGNQRSGIYEIQPDFLKTSINVYCDMETAGGGWTVFQKRDDITPRQDFFLTWNDYKKGFGNLSREFWLGNDYIFALTNQDHMRLRVDLEDFEKNSRFAEHENFLIHSELQNYRMAIGKYSGDAGDSLTGVNNAAFSTKDRDNDTWEENSCAKTYKGAWWYTKCHSANLNGFPYHGNHTSYADGINWYPFKGHHYSLKRTEMKIRPMSF